MKMATYNNQHWLLSHIRNSFISTDDTGMCEAVMLSEDLPNQYVANLNQKYSNKFPNKAEEYLCYPGLLENDEDDDALSQSYDIQMDQDIGLHRQRSNTAQKLEKMDLARRKASKIKNIKCDDSAVSVANTSLVQNDYLFLKKEISTADVERPKAPVKSLLSEQLLKCPKQPQNKFIEYARFDGTAQTGIPTKTMKIFLTMLPEKLRNYPLQICVTSTAKIQEFIGLICYKCSIAYPDIQLNSVKNYGLYITEEDGEVDMDFPALDLREPCSKFCFAHLALVERKYHDSLISQSSSRCDYDRALSITSESDLNKMIAESKAQDEQQNEAMKKMLGHTTMMEAPLYQSYRVFILNKSLFKAEIQLGISGEKIEIDPLQPKNNRFWSKQKAVSHSMETIAWCELIESKTSRATFRIVYSHSLTTPFQQTSIMGVMPPESPLQSSSSFKHYDFETDPTTANEIVKKICNILELKTSSCRRDIFKSLGPKDKKKLLKFK